MDSRDMDTSEPRVIDVRSLPGTTVTEVVRGQGYFPVIAAVGEREVVVALRGGAGHIGLGGRLDLVRSRDAGLTWEAPVTVVDSERDDRNPALGMVREGALALAYHWQGNYDAQGKWSPDLKRQDTRIVYSGDLGRTWTGDEPLHYTPLNGASPFGKIRCHADGTLYLPIYSGPVLPGLKGFVTVGPGTSPSYLLRSRDHGRTWGDPILVAMGLNEADVLFLPDGDWLFAGRSEQADEQAIYLCRSHDEGATWGEVERVTAPHEHPPDLTLLHRDRVLLTFGRRHPPFGVEGLLSQDLGHTWDPRRLVFADDLPGGDIGYPSTILLAGGRLVTVFYSAGTPAQPFDAYTARNAFCRAVCYDEQSLVEACAGTC
ncbi:MAG: sialidase family protein [Candidatus Latescibacterota bacterium]